jgi:hypothetical protein
MDEYTSEVFMWARAWGNPGAGPGTRHAAPTPASAPMLAHPTPPHGKNTLHPLTHPTPPHATPCRGGKNTLVIHNTCEDSLLAAPIILDLVLIAELVQRIELKKDGESAFHGFHPVAVLLSYLTKVRHACVRVFCVWWGAFCSCERVVCVVGGGQGPSWRRGGSVAQAAPTSSQTKVRHCHG